MKFFLLILLFPLITLGQTQIGSDINGSNPDDLFGYSTALSSNGLILAVGSPSEDFSPTHSGYVRVFENTTGTWTQIGSDINGDALGDTFGWSVSLSSDGSILAISAEQSGNNNINTNGYVKVYENLAGTWTQIGTTIQADINGGCFGSSLDISNDGTIIAIGDVCNSTNGADSGQVKVFKNIGGTWIQQGQSLNGEADTNLFGESVALSSNGDILAVGADLNSNINGDYSGHVRVFQFQSGINTWTQIGSDINGKAEEDYFGYSVALSSNGNILAVGAVGNDDNGLESGHVRVYENILGSWTQIGSDINGEAEDDSSGESISLSSDGNILAIGALFNSGNGLDSGHVRIYKNIGGTWTKLGNDIDGEAADDFSGVSVSLSSDGSVLAIGADYNDGGGLDSGHVRVFSIASELALIEVIDDIAGNSNGINVTAAQLNTIDGVSGAIEGVNYTTALGNGTFVDPNNPTAAEIQLIIDQVNAALSVNENDIFSFNLYPNPTTNQFTIHLDTSIQLKQISIYNTLGQEVLTSKEYIINTSKLSSGTYTVKVETSKGKFSKKIIIE